MRKYRNVFKEYFFNYFMKRGGIHIHLSNKLFFTLVAILAIILLGVGVYAVTSPGVSGGWDPGDIPTPGHTIQDIAAPSGCSYGEYLQYLSAPISNGGYWACSNPVSGTVRNVEIKTGYTTGTSGSQVGVVIPCPSGKKIIGGGCISNSNFALFDNGPNSAKTSWVCTAKALSGAGSISGYAICANY